MSDLCRTALRACLLVCAGLAFLAPAAQAETIVAARFAEPTLRYSHAILGDAEEWGVLQIETAVDTQPGPKLIPVLKRAIYTIRLPVSSVFEDISPRLADVDGDGQPEVVVVETDVTRGASLAIYTQKGKLASTPYIGQRNRWLAPIGVGDLDGDGAIELAYIDRPHLAKTLRVWRYANGALQQVANMPGLTNHRIGERDIAGGLRDCGQGPEMIVAQADWRRLMAVRFDGKSLSARDIGPHASRSSFQSALACE